MRGPRTTLIAVVVVTAVSATILRAQQMLAGSDKVAASGGRARPVAGDAIGPATPAQRPGLPGELSGLRPRPRLPPRGRTASGGPGRGGDEAAVRRDRQGPRRPARRRHGRHARRRAAPQPSRKPPRRDGAGRRSLAPPRPPRPTRSRGRRPRSPSPPSPRCSTSPRSLRPRPRPPPRARPLPSRSSRSRHRRRNSRRWRLRSPPPPPASRRTRSS